MEKHKEYSPEEIAKIEEIRAGSDTLLVRRGAAIKPGGGIELHPQQIEAIKYQYDRAVENANRDLDQFRKYINGRKTRREWMPESLERELTGEERDKMLQEYDDRSYELETRMREYRKVLEKIKGGDFKLE
ncbi:MAG: hypothetical protein Q7S49_00635 [bacterium]|nr:hypothetical protein [bacterium]